MILSDELDALGEDRLDVGLLWLLLLLLMLATKLRFSLMKG